MLRRFDAFLREVPSAVGASPSPRYLLAVSGGVDSMVMASLFASSSLKPYFAVAHCNFRLRGAESDGDEALVSDWCEANGVRLYVRGFDTLEYSRSRGVSVEMAARELRYSWFAEICSEDSYSAAAVAHNANDNAETLILNLLRGAGPKGLSGMKAVGEIPLEGCSVPLVRPLLSFSRSEIEQYASENGIAFREDSTNSQTRFKRNKIRNKIFPLFAEINPSFLSVFSREMEHFSEVDSVTDSYFEAVRPGICLPVGKGEVLKADIEALKKDPNWKYVLFRLLEPYGFTADTLSALQRSLADPLGFGGRYFSSPSFTAVLSPSALTVLPCDAVVRDDTPVTVVEGPGDYSFGDVSFRVSVRPWLMGESPVRPRGTLLFDSKAFTFPFKVRPWADGDWMVPLGMKGRRKLSDIFSDEKKGIIEKGKAGVIAHSGSRADAILGERIDDSMKVTPSTVSVVEIKII